MRFIQITRLFKNGEESDPWHLDGGETFYGFGKAGTMPGNLGNGGVNDADGWTYILDRPHVDFPDLRLLPGGAIPPFPDKYHWEFVAAAVCPKTKQIMGSVHYFLPVSKGKGVSFHAKETDEWWKKWKSLAGSDYVQK